MENLGENLLRYRAKDKIFNFFDTETESLNLRFSRPWSVGWIISKGEQIVEKHDRMLWWPDLRVSAGAAIITKFDYSEYKNRAEDPEKVFAEFEQIIHDQKITNVAHNGISFDYSQIDSWARGIGRKTNFLWLNRFIATNAVEKGIRLGIAPQYPLLPWLYKLDSVRRKGLKSNLAFLSREYGLEVDSEKFHGAAYDAEITRQLFFKQIWKCELEDKF